MEQPRLYAKKLYLRLFASDPRHPATQAQHAIEDTAGLTSVREMDCSAVISSLHSPSPDLLADPEALFRAAVPAAILSVLKTLEPDTLLLVEIWHDNSCDPNRPALEEIAALENVWSTSPCGFIHGQALCWPQHYMINSETFAGLQADTPEMHDAPFVWPSPSIYSPSNLCFSFLELWLEYARDPQLSGTSILASTPASRFFREHQMSYAIGSILAHQAGAVHFAPSCVIQQVRSEAGRSLPPELEAAWYDGGLTLRDAGRMLQAKEHSDPLLAVGRASAHPADRFVLRQLMDSLQSGAGRICSDHLRSLLRQSSPIDPVYETLLSDRLTNNDRLWNALVSRVNLIRSEHQINGLETDLSDVVRIIREGLCIELELSGTLSYSFNGQLVWLLLGQSLRRRFRAIYGRLTTAEGSEAMRNFLRGVDSTLLRAVVDSAAPEAKEALCEDLQRQFEFWINHGA